MAVSGAIVCDSAPFRVTAKSISDAFDRAFRRRGSRNLVTIQKAFRLNARELGELFGNVTRQAVEQWVERGVPADRSADVDRVAELASRLARTFKQDRLPSIVRSRIPGLSNQSILETIRENGTAQTLDLLSRLHAWIPGVGQE